MTQILDSGNRTEFSTGAVRDMQDDKGRCDLLPLDVVAASFPVPERIGHSCLVYLEDYKRTKNELYLYYAVASYIGEAYNHDQTEAFLDVSIHYRDGAVKYGENNWQKGLPEWSYISSAVRHYMKYRRGDSDENHRRAALWNLLCLIWTVKHCQTYGGGVVLKAEHLQPTDGAIDEVCEAFGLPHFGRHDEDWSEEE